MPRIALVSLLVFGALAFGWRSLLHYRRTGSTGFRGFTGRPGSAEWLGGALFAATCVLSLVAPIADLLGLVGRVEALDGPRVHVAGLVLFGLGLGGTLWAQLAMGDSWRVGVDTAERTALVRRGPFGLVRNPIFTAMLAGIAGVALMVPNAVALLSVLVLVIGLELHVRLVEEPYLLRTHGAAYRDYAAGTGRFVPGVGRLHAA
jgi:protein-S-isoprenylcysteine O-methyltransferase Ste14